MKSDQAQQRAQRYHSVIRWASRNHEFSLSSLKLGLREEQPGFITRTINELHRGGYLELTSQSPPPTFRWIRDEAAVSAWVNQRIYGTQIKNGPCQDRPRERLLKAGATSLRTAELLAILVRSGRAGESALAAGERIAAAFGEQLDSLPAAGQRELREISMAVGPTAFCQIMAGIELGRRVAAENRDSESLSRIAGSRDAMVFCQQHFSRLAADGKQEEFHIITLDTKNHIINTHRITVGTLDASLVHPREVFRPAIKDAASSIILVHNHPSGDPTPSPEDRQVTERLQSAGKTLGIDVLDHIVVASTTAVSISEQSQ